MKVKVLNAKFHRNGSYGDCFWAATIEVREDPCADFETLHATIGYDPTDEDGDRLDPETCRVTNPLNVMRCYRGGSMADQIIKQIDKIRN